MRLSRVRRGTKWLRDQVRRIGAMRKIKTEKGKDILAHAYFQRMGSGREVGVDGVK